MGNIKKWFAGFIFLLILSFASDVSAARRLNITDWYIQKFDSQIVVNKDSSLDITETIVADCGNLPNKHGIFRILPNQTKLTNGKTLKNPVEIISITNEKGNLIPYSQSKSRETITWKIGDPNKTVQGVNTYIIRYRVKNAIRFQDGFDELYWNLNGNFWDIETDEFHATITFPDGINQSNAAFEYYTGYFGEQRKDLAKFGWASPQTLSVDSIQTLRVREGITVAVTFPKNIIKPYQPTIQEQFGEYIWFLMPVLVLLICFVFWKKYGDDPKSKKTIIPQYDVPGGLSPIEMGMLMKSGGFSNDFITAEIIYFATRGLMKIKESENKILVFKSKDHELIKTENPKAFSELNNAQLLIYQALFKNRETVMLRDLKNSFYRELTEIKKAATQSLKSKGLIQPIGRNIGMVMLGIAGLCVWGVFITADRSGFLSASLALTGLVLFGFSFIMPKRTAQGTELNWQAKGFKLFMETVDKDRAPFYEKENIFEKYLPYAIVFDMTKLWISRMKQLYGEQYFASHVPVWYMGNMGTFDADNFESSMKSLAAGIAANTSAPSGTGGAGGAGGGGGGGGGGGW